MLDHLFCFILIKKKLFQVKDRKTQDFNFNSLAASPLYCMMNLVRTSPLMWWLSALITSESETQTLLSRPPVCMCVSSNIQGIFFQTSSHLTLHVCWSCPVQFITGVNVTFILAMTIMYFSTCQSQVRIIPRVICFVLHVLQSPGTYRCASVLQPIQL